jgi:hypothetical protein
MSRVTRRKLRVITVISSLWMAIVLGISLWPEYPVGNCPDSPPDTAYVCRVGYADDFRKAQNRRNLLIGLEGAVVIAAASILWLLQEPGESLLGTMGLGQERRRRKPASPQPTETAGSVVREQTSVSGPLKSRPEP